MVQQPILEQLSLVGLSLPLPLFAVAIHKYRGSPFGNVLALLAAALVFGIATAMVDAFPVAPATGRVAIVACVGTAAVFSAAGTFQLVRMTTGRCSI